MENGLPHNPYWRFRRRHSVGRRRRNALHFAALGCYVCGVFY